MEFSGAGLVKSRPILGLLLLIVSTYSHTRSLGPSLDRLQAVWRLRMKA